MLANHLRGVLGRKLFPLLFLLALAACHPVREDRSITFSKEGDKVGFQHGSEGVFVASKGGGSPTKVFEPGPEVAAVSTPLWNPKSQLMIFATATPLNGGKVSARPFLQFGRGDDPAGTVFGKQAVRYTCWLRDEPDEGRTTKPVALFQAKCDHIGYVAANLAVRWHADGSRILYIQQTDESRHGLFEYDLATKKSRPAFPHTARALVFDWAPSGSHLVCVLSGTENNGDGIWVGQPHVNDWWQVAGSEQLAQATPDSTLERLKASRPVWTKDGARFACVNSRKEEDRQILRFGTLAGRRMQIILEGTGSIRDLHWSPDGKRLGFVRGGDPGTLHFVSEDGTISPPLKRRPVRHFAGWSTDGKTLAYTVPDKLPYASGKLWAFLLPPDPLARDAVHVAPGCGDDAGSEVFSGTRVTFPAWSPNNDKLSLWFTFSPTHRFVLSYLFGLGIRRGDPAAVFDAKTGAIGWMAVNGYEKAYIGHYHFLKRDYTHALARYREAEQELPPPQRPTLDEFVRNRQTARNLTFFDYFCLQKLGRAEEAKVKLELFRRTYLPELARDNAEGIFSWLRERSELWLALMEDFYTAEVFLSLDAAPDARLYFEQNLKSAKSDARQLSCALALAQILLLENKHADYAELTSAKVLPLLLRTWKPSSPDAHAAGLISNSHLDLLLLGALALAPLQSPEFLGELPGARVKAWLPHWTALRKQADDDATRFGMDLILLAANQCLALDRERQLIWDRIAENPFRRHLLPESGYADPAMLLRQFLTKALP